jgi:signal transduction histidine kinase
MLTCWKGTTLARVSKRVAKRGGLRPRRATTAAWSRGSCAVVNVERAADRLAELVDNLLELTRLQAGRTRLRREPCDLREVAQRLAGAIEPLAQARDQRVEVDFPVEPVPALVDVGYLERALLNLLSNAQTYGRSGGIIRLSLERRSGEVAFAVADDGPGIAAADQAHLFERFYRPETEATRHRQGSGLGLPIARAMVELHGGRIWVDSTPGAGTTLWVVLPTGRHAAPAAARDATCASTIIVARFSVWCRAVTRA